MDDAREANYEKGHGGEFRRLCFHRIISFYYVFKIKKNY